MQREIKPELFKQDFSLGRLAGSTQDEELNKTVNLRLERLSARTKRLEENLDSFVQESQKKYASLAGRITEKNSTERKIEEMIDRHNTLIRTLETRLNQMKRLVEEQEIQIIKSEAALDDAKKEIARLKRL